MKELNISVYFMWEWWERYFHSSYKRPEKISEDALDDMYLKRKRFLYDNFGQYGIGEEMPQLDGSFVDIVTRYGMDFIPYLFGAALRVQDAGGWMPEPFEKEILRKMKAVDLKDHPMAEWIIREKEKKIKRYGKASLMIHHEGPTNIAVRMRGEEFYIDLIEDPSFASYLLELVSETMFHIFGFTVKNFETNSAFGLGNCNVTMISPDLYEKVIRPFDIEFSRRSAEISGRYNDLVLHHCDVKVDRFIETYSRIPNIRALQASHDSDIQRVNDIMPEVDFYAMFNPSEISRKTVGEIFCDVDRAVGLGAKELDIWNVDPGVDVKKLTGIFDAIVRSCAGHGVKHRFSVIPFCWDELEWAFPVYVN